VRELDRRLTGVVLEFNWAAEHTVADAHSTGLIKRSVESVIFTQLRQNLRRMHGVSPLVVTVADSNKKQHTLYKGYPTRIYCCERPNYDFDISRGSVATVLR